ncbi:hypothetical protein [Phenylobacterium montanum]|uniref:Cytochrome c domain-containing protein n=1 Tax=Phenylobacterium montanum TaxID=2823693 RepID=A0A975G2J5_9CAUL|nr:hypothetical protein [Caulobacter sp. S6]QUD89710.1 hypothetical protein KCG34_07520 [Caulobacter sp. S6]
MRIERHASLRASLKLFVAPAAILAALAFGARPAGAVPAFAAQIGQPCQACHVGGFGPQLTPFGREFKLHGYTQRNGDFNVPLSAMAVASYVRTQKDQPPPAPHYGPNDNASLDQFSLFFAGGFGQHLGAFIQTTYDGIGRAFTWDNLDIRAVTTTSVKGHDVLLGASLNNNPTVQDAWNTTPAWGYPYTSSGMAPGPAASPLINGALAQTSLGATAYAWIDDRFLVEGGAYGSPGATTLLRLGSDPTSPGDIKGLAPYGRIAYQQMVKEGVLEVGAFGMQADIHPGLDRTTGTTDSYTDLGVDASYIKTLASTDVVTFNARYTHEHQSLKASCILAETTPAGCASNEMNDIRADASYYWRNKIGGTVSVFDTFGSSNPFIYAGNRTFKPDSTGVTLQLDGTPWGAGHSPFGQRFNMRVGLQYTFYTTFNGAGSNWDGAGSNASDNNTFRVFTWFAY